MVNAINAVPSSGGVVFIPEGTYPISSAITISKSGVVIRGAGPDKTKLRMNGSGNSFNITLYDRGASQGIGTDVTRNSSAIILPVSKLPGLSSILYFSGIALNPKSFSNIFKNSELLTPRNMISR